MSDLCLRGPETAIWETTRVFERFGRADVGAQPRLAHVGETRTLPDDEAESRRFASQESR
jgi:hypothetical protein